MDARDLRGVTSFLRPPDLEENGECWGHGSSHSPDKTRQRKARSKRQVELAHLRVATRSATERLCHVRLLILFHEDEGPKSDYRNWQSTRTPSAPSASPI
ncbi:hypothetical protein EVAR_69179_1 [Eumeta japonica]|uniref:Uncharacterized protein n=1 Tax=Eumeta variegata TaxID=151549 RepID=A0A4C1ZFC8_EUMVA|nr:hypothetical protein EVAR_69179_1 [Eumeta japonica]